MSEQHSQSVAMFMQITATEDSQYAQSIIQAFNGNLESAIEAHFSGNYSQSNPPPVVSAPSHPPIPPSNAPESQNLSTASSSSSIRDPLSTPSAINIFNQIGNIGLYTYSVAESGVSYIWNLATSIPVVGTGLTTISNYVFNPGTSIPLVDQARVALKEYEERWGTNHPRILLTNYHRAIAKSKEELKPLVILLYSSESNDTDKLFRTILSDQSDRTETTSSESHPSPLPSSSSSHLDSNQNNTSNNNDTRISSGHGDFCQYLDNNDFLFWMADIAHSDGSNVSKVLNAKAFPFMAVLACVNTTERLVLRFDGLLEPAQSEAPSLISQPLSWMYSVLFSSSNSSQPSSTLSNSSSAGVTVGKIPSSLTQLTTILSGLKARADRYYEPFRVQKAARQAEAEMIRRQQIEYEQAIEKDRQIIAAARKKRRLAQLQKEKVDRNTLLKSERQANRKAKWEHKKKARQLQRAKIAENLSKSGSSGIDMTRLRIRLPTGKSVTQAFPQTCTVQSVLQWVDAFHNIPMDLVQLVAPPTTHSDTSMTLFECSLIPKAAVYIQFKPDISPELIRESQLQEEYSSGIDPSVISPIDSN